MSKPHEFFPYRGSVNSLGSPQIQRWLQAANAASLRKHCHKVQQKGTRIRAPFPVSSALILTAGGKGCVGLLQDLSFTAKTLSQHEEGTKEAAVSYQNHFAKHSELLKSWTLTPLEPALFRKDWTASVARFTLPSRQSGSWWRCMFSDGHSLLWFLVQELL